MDNPMSFPAWAAYVGQANATDHSYKVYLENVKKISESDFRKAFNRSLKTDNALRKSLMEYARTHRTRLIFKAALEATEKDGIVTIKVPSLHSFFKEEREKRIQFLYFCKK